MCKYKSTRTVAPVIGHAKTRISFMERCYVMKHQQIQLASKRNFIRVAALVVMLVLMVCCTVILTTAEPVPESFVGSHDYIPGETGFRLGENGKWVKTYDGTTGIGIEGKWIKDVRLYTDYYVYSDQKSITFDEVLFVK